MAAFTDAGLTRRVGEKSDELARLLQNEAIDSRLREKLAALCADLLNKERVTVAFSAGVDSSLLVALAHRLLGDACVAITAQSALLPRAELQQATSFCERQGVRHVLVPYDEMRVEQVRRNDADRCYWCKLALMGKVQQIACLLGCPCVVEGSNASDAADYRPGSRAVQELGIASPLANAGMAKDDVRELARVLGLSVWDKPSCACLASRIPYGEEVTAEKLSMIEAAEALLAEKGFGQVRVRVHESAHAQALFARIEVPRKDLPRFADANLAANVDASLRALGFLYVSLDLGGYETGKLNREVLNEEKTCGRVMEEL